MSEKERRSGRNVVFILGSGASAAICPDKIPCMGDYFEKWIKLTEDKKETKYWLTLACLEETRIFPPNPEAENLATRIRTIGWEIDSFQEKGLPVDELHKTQQNYLESYILDFKQDNRRTRANLERILAVLEPLRGSDADDAKGRLLMSIHTFFRTLDMDSDISQKFKQGPHQKLADFLKQHKDLHVTFISFNYDIWLEKVLQEKDLWNPSTGYGHPFLYTRPHGSVTQTGAWGNNYEAKPFNNPLQSGASVLKPNGSLSWFFTDGNEPVLLTSNGKETGQISYNSDYYLDRVDIGNTTDRMLRPLIVPPIPTANRRYSVFWSIDKKLQTSLQEADTVVIIGWSLPDTDQKFAEDFKRAVNTRPSQLESLVLCDIRLNNNDGSRSQLIHKFESLFRPRKPAITRKPEEEDGFSTAFIEFLANVL